MVRKQQLNEDAGQKLSRMSQSRLSVGRNLYVGMGTDLQEKDLVSEACVESFRRWFSSHILHPFLLMEEHNRSLLLSDAPPHLSNELGSCSSLLHLVMTRLNPDHPLAAQRKALHRFVSVEGYPRAEEYCLHRLKVLSRDTCMSAFHWDRGDSWGGRTFEAYGFELPTDSELLVHAFGAYFDSLMPVEQEFASGSFTKRFLFFQMDFPDGSGRAEIEPWRRKAGIVLCRVSSRPPHFLVLSPNGGVIEPVPGRNNSFHALILLVRMIQQEYDGYAGPLHLGNRSIDLLRCVDEAFVTGHQ